MVASYRPDLALAVAFNADPNDPNATPVWTNQTFRLRHADAIRRGRQYELDQNQAGQPTMTLWDPDEYLNPGNPSSPYSPNVVPYRQILMQAVWPNPCTGNLLNAKAVPTGYDPDFETTAVGATPPNLLTFNTSPTVVASNPFTGTKSLQWSVAGNSSEQVTGFTIPCVPGRAYITSVYYRQTAANTGVIFINGGATGNSTTTTGAYVRLSVAFVATQPTHQVYVGSYSPTLASTINVDAIQHEQATPLNANPTFETGTTNWTPHGGTATLSTVWQQQGQSSLLLTPDGVSSQCYAESEQVPATAGAPYLVAGWAYAPNAVSSFSFSVNWYDASHAYLSTTSHTLSLTAGSVTERDDQVTAPVGAAYATAVPTIGGTPSTSQRVYVDNVALYSATPSAFTTTGSVIYPVLRDYVERWPSEWEPNSAGFAGLAEITCVDALATLQGVYLHTEYVSSILNKKPDYYWRLGEPQGATTFGETSGNNGPPMQRIDSATGGAATFQIGTQTAIPGDPGATGLQMAPNDPNGQSAARAGTPVGSPGIKLGGGMDGSGYSVAIFLDHKVVYSGTSGYLINIGDGYTLRFYAYVDQPPNSSYPVNIGFNATYPGGNKTGIQEFPDSFHDDGKDHLLVFTVSRSAGQGTATAYLDGTQVGTWTGAAGSGPWTSTYVDLGGWINPLDNSGAEMASATYSHLALWNRTLSPSEIADLWNAGRWGYLNEYSGQRVARYLTGNYTGTTAIDTGQSLMGISNLAAQTTLFAACQSVATSENGNLWIDSGGTLQFAARTRRYLATTSKVTFGERTDLGEIPYAGDIKFNFDPTYVYNDVEVTNAGGIVTRPTDATSQRKYFPRSYQRTVNVASDNEAVDAANWILNTHKAPAQRVERITLDPASYPAAWPVVLGLEIGTRVTVKRRAKAANGGAGLTMSLDFFVESIEHSSIDMDAGTWTTTLLLSPAIGYQVGIFGDPQYGVFDQTLIFGY